MPRAARLALVLAASVSAANAPSSKSSKRVYPPKKRLRGAARELGDVQSELQHLETVEHRVEKDLKDVLLAFQNSTRGGSRGADAAYEDAVRATARPPRLAFEMRGPAPRPFTNAHRRKKGARFETSLFPGDGSSPRRSAVPRRRGSRRRRGCDLDNFVDSESARRS